MAGGSLRVIAGEGSPAMPIRTDLPAHKLSRLGGHGMDRVMAAKAWGPSCARAASVIVGASLACA